MKSDSCYFLLIGLKAIQMRDCVIKHYILDSLSLSEKKKKRDEIKDLKWKWWMEKNCREAFVELFAFSFSYLHAHREIEYIK